MNRKLLSALVLASTAMAAQVASAADGTITFNGAITAQTCTVSGNGQGKDFVVTLPTVSTTALAAAGQRAGKRDFKIELTNCTPNSGNAYTYFEPGVTTDLTTGHLIVAAGGATNVQIALQNDQQQDIKAGFAPGAQNSQVVAITNGAASMDYWAEYVAVNGPAGAGAANSSVMYSIVYQ